ncbi:MAG: histidine kinase [Verrucomicrobia bacterium]|nr:histidine kinase [Verrucomicrobiota bacterium]
MTAKPPPPSRATPWLMSRLANIPLHGSGWSIGIIAVLIAIVGWIDYSTGPRLSLELFYLIPISLSVAWFGSRVGCLIALVSILTRVGGDLASGAYNYPRTASWNRFADLLSYFAIVWVLDALITLQRQLEQRVKDRTAELLNAAAHRRQLEHELLVIGSRERNVFGQELHDDICQHLVGTALAAKVLTQHLQASGAAMASQGQAIVDLIEQGAEKTRKLARGLLLSAIEPNKLADSLGEFAHECSSAALPCRFRHEGAVLVSDAGIAAQLFRIAQEAVRNALKHAGARRIEIALVGTGDAITLVVDDDGHGLPPDDQRGHGMGLRIMSHRAALMDGVLTITSDNGRGTRVACRLARGP